MSLICQWTLLTSAGCHAVTAQAGTSRVVADQHVSFRYASIWASAAFAPVSVNEYVSPAGSAPRSSQVVIPSGWTVIAWVVEVIKPFCSSVTGNATVYVPGNR